MNIYKLSKSSKDRIRNKCPNTMRMMRIATLLISGLPNQYQQKYIDVYNQSLKELRDITK